MGKKSALSSPLALGLLSAVPGAKDPVDAILWHAGALVIESGISEPPYTPASYALLRNVKEIVHRDMEVDGRLVPSAEGFIIELRKDRSHERKNFTLAHELAHTFFYESVPSIKYRSLSSTQPHHDADEETLCNIAAAEMLMPSPVFSKIAKDYSATPQSLQELARLFETSILATTVHLLRLGIWNTTFILWSLKHDQIVATWMAQPRRGLVYSPSLEILHPQESSIFHSFKAGNATSSTEWLCLNKGYKLCQIHSLRLNNKMVLSGITQHPANQCLIPAKSNSTLPSLPMEYDCVCDGTGWRSFKKEGRTYATRCRASDHKTY